MNKFLRNTTIAGCALLAAPHLYATGTSEFRGGLVSKSAQEHELNINVDGIGFIGTFTHYFKDLRNERRSFLADFKLQSPYVRVGFTQTGLDGSDGFYINGVDSVIKADVTNSYFALAGGTWLENGLGIEAMYSNESSKIDYNTLFVDFDVEADTISTDESEKTFEIKPSYYFSKTQQVGLVYESIKSDWEEESYFGVTTQSVFNESYYIKGSIVSGTDTVEFEDAGKFDFDVFKYEFGGGYISKKFGFYGTITMGKLKATGDLLGEIGDLKVTELRFTQLYSINKELHAGIELAQTRYSENIELENEYQYLGYLIYWF